MTAQIKATNGQLTFCAGKLVRLVESRRGGQQHRVRTHIRDGETAFFQRQGQIVGKKLYNIVASSSEIQFRLQQIVLVQAHAGGVGDRFEHGGKLLSWFCFYIRDKSPLGGKVRVVRVIGGSYATMQTVGCILFQILQGFPCGDFAIDKDAQFPVFVAGIGDGVGGNRQLSFFC